MNLVFRSLCMLCLGTLVAGAASLHAQSFRGQLTDRDDEPLEGVRITVVRSNDDEIGSVSSDTAGMFEIALPRGGLYRIRAEKPGYRTAISNMINVGSGERRRIDFELPRERVTLDSMVVVGRRRVPVMHQGFYQRLDTQPFGIFVTRDDVTATRPLLTTDLLRKVPGLQFVQSPNEGNRLLLRGGCSPTLYIDGTRVNGQTLNLDQLVGPRDIEGIEVYRSIAEAPPQYQGVRAGCAAILVWTRVGRS